MDSRQHPSEHSSRPVKDHSGLEGTHESRVGQVSSVASCRSIPTAIRTPNYRRRRRGVQRATSTFHASVTHSAHARARARARTCVRVRIHARAFYIGRVSSPLQPTQKATTRSEHMRSSLSLRPSTERCVEATNIPLSSLRRESGI